MLQMKYLARIRANFTRMVLPLGICLLITAAGIGTACAQGKGGGKGGGNGGGNGGGGSTVPAPTGLTGAGVSNSEILLEWNSGGGDTAGFEIAYRKGAMPKGKKGTNVDVGNVTRFTLTGLDRNSTYGIQVRAYDTSGAMSDRIEDYFATLNTPDYVDLMVVHDFSTFSQADLLSASVVQPDGKIVAAGFAHKDAVQQASADFLVVRFNDDGSLDSSFGNNGTTRIDIQQLGRDWAKSICLDDFGRILVSGPVHVSSGSTMSSAAMVRLLSDGTLDASFGDGGVVIFSPFTYVNAAKAHPLANGQLLLVGDGATGPYGDIRDYIVDGDVYIARFDSDGTLDTSFGTDGYTITDLANGSKDHVGEHAGSTMQSDGKLLVAGSIDDIAAVSRFHSDGSLDTSFGISGFQAVPLSTAGQSRYQAVVVDLQGNLFASGQSLVSGDDTEAVLTKFNSDGSVDDFFGVQGTFRINLGLYRDEGWRPVIDGDRIVVAGQSNGDASWPASQALIYRVNSDGTLDETFADNGTYLVEESTENRFFHLTLDNFGWYVAVGEFPTGDAPDGGHRSSLLMRFDPN